MGLYKAVYLAAKNHRLNDVPYVDFLYNDVDFRCNPDFLCDMLAVPLDRFDFVIATPPCNYYSKANYQREKSKVAQATKHLLPSIIEKLRQYTEDEKPWLVENVRNWSLMPKPDGVNILFFGNHTWWTNVSMLGLSESCAVPQHKALLSYGHRDDNENVDIFIRYWLFEVLHRRIPTLRMDKRFMPSKKAT